MEAIEGLMDPLDHAVAVLSLAYKTVGRRRAPFKIKLLKEYLSTIDEIKCHIELVISLLEQGDPTADGAEARPGVFS
jgi:hypothetical protein